MAADQRAELAPALRIAPHAARPRRSTAAALLLALVRVYQGFVSPLMPSACKFYPSCSHYAAKALEVHGARRGMWMALLRVLRCRPFSPGGYDPVPERREAVRVEAANSSAPGARR